MKHIALTCLFALLFCCQLTAKSILPVQKISESFVFDGKISEEEWNDLEAVPLTVQTPVYRGTPSERTIIKLGYDENYIYLLGAMYDSDAKNIPANNRLRDGGDETTDWFGLVIDSYNDNQNALCFFTTPTGSRWDAAIQNDAQGRNPMNLSWNNFWDVKTSITDEGWFSEMRIPFSSLQFQVVDGKVTMGITIWRYIARANEMQISPDISPDLGDMGGFMASQTQEYVFENIKQKKPFYIAPYLLTGYGAQNVLNSSETGYNAESNFLRNAGLDVKYGITNNYTLDLTLNTDFAQVEVDDQQINLSRFSLFFPEKRLFFQERSGIFDFGVGSRNNLFYSRRIGIDSKGNAIPIIGGARLTGRSGDLDVGIISMQTAGVDGQPGNNFSVLRFKKQVVNDLSQVGFLFTNRIDTKGMYNSVYGFDSNINVFSDNFLNVKFAQTITQGVESNYLSADPSLFWISFSRRGQDGFSYGTSLSRVGSDFDAQMGFFERSDYTRFGARVRYTFFPGESSSLFRHGVHIRGASFWDNSTDKYNTAFYMPGYEWNWRNGMSFEAAAVIRYDDITSSFLLAGVAEVPVGGYFFTGGRLQFGSPTNYPFLVKGEINSGTFYNGYRNTFNVSPVYNISSSFGLSADYEYNAISFDDSTNNFKAHIARIKAQLMFSTQFSISSFIQYNSLQNVYLGNIRLRYNPREGNDLFIVYNSDLNASRDMFEPRLPVYNQTSLLVKYTYTFKI